MTDRKDHNGFNANNIPQTPRLRKFLKTNFSNSSGKITEKSPMSPLHNPNESKEKLLASKLLKGRAKAHDITNASASVNGTKELVLNSSVISTR